MKKDFTRPQTRSRQTPSPATGRAGEWEHRPVLLNEVLEYLNLQSDGIYVDATFGRGGHSQAILERLGPNGRLYALDRDPEAVAAGNRIKDERFSITQGTFADLESWLTAEGISGLVNAVLFDLGVSSPQLDNPQRGFSFLREGPLDMRMDPLVGRDAAFWLQQAAEKEIAEVLRRYGEERFARRIAAAIVRARAESPIETTTQLADIVSQAHPRWERHKHPATRTFQAIRLFVNQELESLTAGLSQGLEVLAVGGRLLAISFHSLEDRIVKRFIADQARGGDFPPDLPIPNEGFRPRLKKVCKLIRPGAEEIQENPRARSALLRVAEKLG